MVWNDITWKGSPNFTGGRQGLAPRFITFHHIVGSMESANSRFQNASQQVSTHFAVGERGVWQFVDTDNTAWGNGNWNSNLESISIEHEGDWRFGYYNAGCLEQSAQLIALLRKTHPSIVGYNIHRDVSLSGTVCPGDLPFANIWNRSTQIMNPPAPTPPPVTPPPTPVPGLQVTDVQNRLVVTNKDCNLWDLSFTTWAGTKSVKVLPRGTQIEVSATAKHGLGGIYYLSEYSFSKGIMNGINSADVDEITVKPVDPPVVVPPPVVTPPPVVVPPPVTPPLDEETVGLLKSIMLKLGDIIKSITDFLTRRGK